MGPNFKKKLLRLTHLFKKLNDDEASDDEDDTGLLPASRGKKYFHKLYVLVIIANLGIFENILHFFIKKRFYINRNLYFIWFSGYDDDDDDFDEDIGLGQSGSG